MTIRKPTQRDLDRIHEITVLAFGPYCMAKPREDRYGTIDGAGWDVHKATSTRNSCEKLMGRAFVAEADGPVVGYSSHHVHELREIGEVGGNAVDPASIVHRFGDYPVNSHNTPKAIRNKTPPSEQGERGGFGAGRGGEYDVK